MPELFSKRIEFGTASPLGQHFAEAVDITPRGGGLTKIAGALHPEIAAYLHGLRPDPRYQYVLMTPMGAFEYWGMNVNGDIFPKVALAYDLTRDDPTSVIRDLVHRWLVPHGKQLPPGDYKEFGHKTFLAAERYRHHVNKDPSQSYGGIVLAVYNPSMQRVELIVRHDREKAKRVGAEEIIIDIDAGKPRQISMGCKVPWDVCTKCGNISRTQSTYCDCLRHAMGRVDKNGSVIGAVNFFPRFFDLSDVFIPAAKESGVLRKVASVKGAAQDKAATIEKVVLPNSRGTQMLREMCAREPDLPDEALRHGQFSKLLTTLAALGIVLKPHEFQYGMLHHIGRGDLADRMRGKVVRPMPTEVVPRLSSSDFSLALARALSGILPQRSGFLPHLPRRAARITIINVSPRAQEEVQATGPVLQKVAQAYSAYRGSLRFLPDTLDSVVTANFPFYREHFFGEVLTDALEKRASVFRTASLSSVPVSVYLNGAYGDRLFSGDSLGLSVSPLSPARALFVPSL